MAKRISGKRWKIAGSATTASNRTGGASRQ